MAQKMSVLLLSHSGTRLNTLEDTLLDHSGISTIRKLLSPQSRTPLAELSSVPDVILLDLGADWQSELYSVAEDTSLRDSPPLIVLGSSDDASMMRKAMQAGARDYFASPISEEELVASIRQIGKASQQVRRQNSGKVTCVINGKGGSGATVIASNLAKVALGQTKKNPATVVLVGLDLQFGDIPVYLDLESNDNLMQALVGVDTLDAIAIDGFAQKHSSGIHVLASKPEQIRSTADISPIDVTNFLTMLSRYYDHVIVDLPRVLDPLTISALEIADNVLIATQQSVPHVRDTRYLLSLLRDIGVSSKNTHIVLNRFNKKSEIRLTDIREVFQDINLTLVPEDLKRVSYSVNNGIPMIFKWPKAPFSKSLEQLGASLWPVQGVRGGKGLFNR